MSEAVEERIALVDARFQNAKSIGWIGLSRISALNWNEDIPWLITALRAALAEVADHEAMLLGEMRRCEKAEADAARWKAALELPAMFHKGGIWTVADSDRWQQITGSTEVTTKVMCDHIRAALTAPAREGEKK